MFKNFLLKIRPETRIMRDKGTRVQVVGYEGNIAHILPCQSRPEIGTWVEIDELEP